MKDSTATRELKYYMRKRKHDLIDLAISLIRCRPAYEEGARGILEAQNLIVEELRQLNMQPRISYITPSLSNNELYVDPSDVVSEDLVLDQFKHPQVSGIWDVGNSITLVLNGHVDVESVRQEQWTKKTWASGEVVEDRIYGRGSSDMLASLAAYIFALQAIKNIASPAVNVIFHSVSNEELGGNGTLALTQSLKYYPDWVIIGEPTGNKICKSTLGFHHFSVEIEGISAHMGNLDPSETTIERLPDIISALQHARILLKRRISESSGFDNYIDNPLVMGMLNAGSLPGVSPTNCILQGTAYSAPGDSSRDVFSILESCMSGIRNVKLNMHKLSFPGNDPTHGTLVENLITARDTLGLSSISSGFSSPCDLRLYAQMNVDSVVYGPGRLSEAHAVDEYVGLTSLMEYSHSLAELLLGSTRDARTVK